ncbi:hypothetical protein ACGFNU_03415 [Spirillospora sp. NPDC048911]|uniref:hypothetical protein n=1 Tax=Spirillospora sp. NPDC048911 TaxID=3364527 RepID=UPI0037226E06
MKRSAVGGAIAGTAVGAELRERTGGRGPDVCIEAVGMEAHTTGPQQWYDQAKHQLRLQTDRPSAVREAIYACRKGGSVFVLGVFGGVVDKFPLGALMNKGLTLRAAQMHGQRYIPMLLDRVASGELSTRHLATHSMSLNDAPEGYDPFKHKKDGCVRAVFSPHDAHPTRPPPPPSHRRHQAAAAEPPPLQAVGPCKSLPMQAAATKPPPLPSRRQASVAGLPTPEAQRGGGRSSRSCAPAATAGRRLLLAPPCPGP